MKKVGLLLILSFMAFTTVSAQSEAYTSEKAGRKTTFQQNGFGDNWFIGLGARGSVYVGDNDQHADIMDRPTLGGQFFIGKWFNPTFGMRLNAYGGSIHNFEGNEGQKMYHQNILGGSVDFMFNMTNYFCKYNSKRFYNFIPNVGVGYAHGFAKDWGKAENNTITFNASLLNTFRLSDKISAFIEIGGTIVDDQFDGDVGGDWNWEGIAHGSAGFIVNFGGRTTWNEAVLYDQALIDELNATINSQKARIADLEKRPVSCPSAPTCPPAPTCPTPDVDNVYVPNVVFFRIGSAVIDKNQEINIYNTAEYLKANPDAKVKIVGYADKKTGSASINMKLSEKRAKTVAKALVEKYGISNSRVSTEWKGATEQPYKVNEWNRVAIFFAD